MGTDGSDNRYGSTEGHQSSGGVFTTIYVPATTDPTGHLFVSDFSGELQSLSLNLCLNDGAVIVDETITVQIHAIVNGLPDASNSLCSATEALSSLSLPFYSNADVNNTQKTFTFETPAQLSLGMKYAISVTGSGPVQPNVFCISTETSDPGTNSTFFSIFSYSPQWDVWGIYGYYKIFLFDLEFTAVTQTTDTHQVSLVLFDTSYNIPFDQPTGQIFTAEYTENIKAIGLRLIAPADTSIQDGDITVQIVGTTTDNLDRVIPDSDNVLCSATVPASSLALFSYGNGLSPDTAYISFYFDTEATLISGTQYAFIISSSGTVFPRFLVNTEVDSNYPIWKKDQTWEIHTSYLSFYDLFYVFSENGEVINATITYHSNNATSGIAPAPTSWESGSQGGYYVAYNTGYLERTGFNFVGWNTSASGAGTSYQEAQLVAPWFSQDIILYAHWVEITNATITYNSNDATSGTVPSPTSWESESPGGYYVAYNTGYLERTGFTFAGWNTSVDGTGTSYQEAQLVAPWFSQDITLYAKWSPIVQTTLTFNGNGSTLGDVPDPLTHNSGETLQYTYLTPFGVKGLGRVGYLFTGWNTQDDGLGIQYDDNALITTWFTQNTTLYAQWQSGYVTLIYDGNGETGGYPPAPENAISGEVGPKWLAGNTNFLVKTGATFLGWNMSTDGSGTTYTSVSPWFTQTTTIYALWLGNATVTFDGNGETSGSLPSQTESSGDSSGSYLRSIYWTYPDEFKKTGYIFAGWNTEAEGGGIAYSDDALIQPWFSQDITLYAQWIDETSQVVVSFDGHGSDQGLVPESQAHTAGSTDGWLLPSASINGLGKEGFFLSGWNTAADGSGSTYFNQQLVSPWFYQNTVLYAQWQPNVSNWTVTSLPVEPRAGLSSAVLGTKVIFAGGATGNAASGPFTSRVDMYDSFANTWTQLTSLDQPRYLMASAAVGSKVLFAGGVSFAGESDNVDIYVLTNPESPTHLSDTLPVSARHCMSSAVVGTLAIFAGGYNGSVDLADVVVYDSSTSNWSTITPLSIGRSFMASAVISTTSGTFVLFGGGYTNGGWDYSDVIDVYDFTNPSSPFLIPRTTPGIPTVLPGGARSHLASAVIGDLVIFAGGEISSSYTGSSAVDIFNMSTGAFLTEVPELSVPRSTLVSAVLGNSVIFAGGLVRSSQVVSSDTVDIYDFTDPQSPVLSSTVLPLGPRAYLTSAVVDTSFLMSNKLKDVPDQVALFAGGDAGGFAGPAVADIDILGVPSVETGNGVLISRDGSIWNTITTAPKFPWKAICWSPYLHLFCAVASTGQITTSPDGSTWTLCDFNSTFTDWQAICWSPELEKFCGLAYADDVLASITSMDGITWVENPITFEDVEPKHVFDLCWSPELRTFCAVGNRILLSTDGISWEVIRNIKLASVCWSSEEHIFCAVSSDKENLMTSNDGRIWIGRSDVPKSIKVIWSPELRAFGAGKDSDLITVIDGIVVAHKLPVDYGSWLSGTWSPELMCICIIGNQDAILTLY